MDTQSSTPDHRRLRPVTDPIPFQRTQAKTCRSNFPFSGGFSMRTMPSFVGTLRKYKIITWTLKITTWLVIKYLRKAIAENIVKMLRIKAPLLTKIVNSEKHLQFSLSVFYGCCPFRRFALHMHCIRSTPPTAIRLLICPPAGSVLPVPCSMLHAPTPWLRRRAPCLALDLHKARSTSHAKIQTRFSPRRGNDRGVTWGRCGGGAEWRGLSRWSSAGWGWGGCLAIAGTGSYTVIVIKYLLTFNRKYYVTFNRYSYK